MTRLLLQILTAFVLMLSATANATEHSSHEAELRSFDLLFGGAVSDGGGDRARSAVLVSFLAYQNYGVDSFAINYLNTVIADANQQSYVESYFQNVFGSFGQTNICVHFNKGEFEGAALAYALVEQLAIQVVSDEAYYNLSEQRTKVFLNKDCVDLSSATQQNLNNYIN